jgi:hypothetical protein
MLDPERKLASRRWVMGVWIAVAVVVGLGVLAAWMVDRRARRRGHRLRGGGSMWRDEVREHRRDVKAGDAQGYMDSDRSWTRDKRR